MNNEMIRNLYNSDIFISFSKNSIIKVNHSNDLHIVPPSNGTFSTPITIRESDEKLYVSPFDLYDEIEHSLSIKDLISSDSILKKGDKIGDISFKYEFDELDKEKIDKIVSLSSYEKNDIIGLFVDILEEYPNITKSNYNKFLPSDLVDLIYDLSSVHYVDMVFDYIINQFSNSEFYKLINCENKEERLQTFNSIIHDYRDYDDYYYDNFDDE